MEAHGRVLVMVCTIYILKLACLPSHNIVFASSGKISATVSPSATITVGSPSAASSTSVVLPSASQAANPTQMISPSSAFTALTSSVNSTVKPTANPSKMSPSGTTTSPPYTTPGPRTCPPTTVRPKGTPTGPPDTTTSPPDTMTALGVPCNSPCLLVSAGREIIALDFNNGTSYPIISRAADAIDIHFSRGYIFWGEYPNIKRANIDGTNITTVHNNIGNCGGLAVEWRSMQLYWTDTIRNTISVSDLEGNNRRILVSSNLDRPQGIAVDPNQGLMFWTDSGQTPKIERATLSGTQRVAIVTSNVLFPRGIDLDRRNKLVFWVDRWTHSVESVDYHGNNRKLLLLLDVRLYGVTFVSPYIFFSDWDYEAIHKLNAFNTNGTVLGYIQFNWYKRPLGLVAYDSSRQISGTTSPPDTTTGPDLIQSEVNCKPGAICGLSLLLVLALLQGFFSVFSGFPPS